MEQQASARILPFRHWLRRRMSRRVGGGGRVTPPASGAAPALAPPLHDEEINERWDVFLRLATQAWCYRDVESLEAVAGSLGRVRELAALDWQP
jgi:hypothetical protein